MHSCFTYFLLFQKLTFDVLIKTCDILSKIMVILDICNIKVLTIFAVEYHTLFPSSFWKRESVYQVLFALFTFFLHANSVHSGWKSRRMKVFYFVIEFLVYKFVSLHSTCFFNNFFNFSWAKHTEITEQIKHAGY